MRDGEKKKRQRAELAVVRSGEGTLLVRLAGTWSIYRRPPSSETVRKAMDSESAVRRIAFDVGGLAEWDSSLPALVAAILRECAQRGIQIDQSGLPPGILRLIRLSQAGSEQEGLQKGERSEPVLARIGGGTLRLVRSAGDTLSFLGEVVGALFRLFCGKAAFRASDLLLTMQDCGARAVPIVSLIGVLVGMILGFLGAIQLRAFGAQIYVADLVGISMVRVMGSVMTAIIMAGRTGAAFAAELGTMQANEEIDALETLGLSPVEFLVLPRILALILMMPLLGIYADLMGILGGFLVGAGVLGLAPVEYYHQTKAALSLNHIWVGILHATVFGALVAISGCYQGIRCGRSAEAVGKATTSAVVTGLISIIVATGIINVCTDVLGI